MGDVIARKADLGAVCFGPKNVNLAQIYGGFSASVISESSCKGDELFDFVRHGRIELDTELLTRTREQRTDARQDDSKHFRLLGRYFPNS